MKSSIPPLLLMIGLAACIDDPPTDLAPLLPVSFSTYAAYAGAPLTIRSAQFTQLRDIEIWADTLELPILHAAGDSVVITLPRQVRGTVRLRLGRDGPALGDVEVAGFVGRRSITRMVNPEMMVWPAGAQASVLAGTQEGDVVRILPASGSITTLLSGYEFGATLARKPGRTPDPNVLLFQTRGGGPQHAWRLLPTPQQLYTLPWPNGRRFAQLSDSIFFNGFHHTLNTFRYSNGSTQTVFSGAYEDAQNVFISPNKRIAAIDLNGSEVGIPVFNALTGDTLYRIPFRWSVGTTFSQGGDTLWMVVGSSGTNLEQVVMFDPANGSLRRSVALPGYSFTSMMRDPAGGRLFVFGLDSAERSAGRFQINLFVLNDRDLTLLGQMQASVECNQACQSSGVVTVGTDGVFLVTPIEIYEFDYLQ